MEDNEEVYRRMQEFFGGLNSNFSLMEDPVDVALQMSYFEMSGKMRDSVDEKAVLHKKDELFDPEVSIQDKRELLVQLAGIPDTAVYRTLESYAKQPDADLNDWAKLALQENKMLLEGHLLDERPVFISTGLGGKGRKLRYFVVLINKHGDNLKPFEQKVVHDDMLDALQRYDGELEKLNFMNQYVTMRVVVPISADLTRLFRDGIEECNQFGNFLSTDFLITNMKEMNEKEIEEALSGDSDQKIEDDFPPVD